LSFRLSPPRLSVAAAHGEIYRPLSSTWWCAKRRKSIGKAIYSRPAHLIY